MTLWHNADVNKPKDDKTVIVCVSGRVRNVTYLHAVMTGAYCDDEGVWVLDDYLIHGNEENVKVEIWTNAPKLPKKYMEDIENETV